MLHLLQKHTIDIYNLNNEEYIVENVKADTLLDCNRFDLFAKIGYIRNKELNNDLAISIYSEHIKAFNPDLKEPGRDDKNGLDDFINTFDELIDKLKSNSFDPNISLIPIDKNGIILDGAHRVSALAYYNKSVDVIRFPNVTSKAIFNYQYFRKRGLSNDILDKIALEALFNKDNIYVACLWPKMGNYKKRSLAIDLLEKKYKILYTKEMTMSLNDLSMFIYEIYKEQDWVGNEDNNFAGARNKATFCYAKNSLVKFVFFQADNLNNVLALKDEIRDIFNFGKHSIHITDNHKETIDIANLILTEKVKDYNKGLGRLKDTLSEQFTIFKNVHWINFKVLIASLINKILN